MDRAERTVQAPPERVWELVSDITRAGEWSPEATGGRWRGDATGPAVGARFTGGNRHGRIRWSTHCRVTECEPPHRFTFVVTESRTAWGWILEPAGDGATGRRQSSPGGRRSARRRCRYGCCSAAGSWAATARR